MNKVKTIGNVLANIISIIGALILVYVIICYVEVLNNNMAENPKYSEWNCLVNISTQLPLTICVCCRKE